MLWQTHFTGINEKEQQQRQRMTYFFFAFSRMRAGEREKRDEFLAYIVINSILVAYFFSSFFLCGSVLRCVLYNKQFHRWLAMGEGRETREKLRATKKKSRKMLLKANFSLNIMLLAPFEKLVFLYTLIFFQRSWTFFSLFTREEKSFIWKNDKMGAYALLKCEKCLGIAVLFIIKSFHNDAVV